MLCGNACERRALEGQWLGKKMVMRIGWRGGDPSFYFKRSQWTALTERTTTTTAATAAAAGEEVAVSVKVEQWLREIVCLCSLITAMDVISRCAWQRFAAPTTTLPHTFRHPSSSAFLYQSAAQCPQVVA